MAHPISFDEMSGVRTAPPGQPAVGDLPVWSDGSVCVSLWRLTWGERLAALWRGKIWLRIRSGQTQPPVALHTEKPAMPRCFLKGPTDD